MSDNRREYLPTRKSLLSRLKNWDDQSGWKEFFDTYWRLIYRTAWKSGLTDAEAQDVVQEVVISVCKKIGDLKYDPALGSFKGWLLTLTRWRIVDEFRKRDRAAIHPAIKGAARTTTDAMASIPDPNGFDLDSVWREEWEKAMVEAALTRVRTRVSPKQYQIFDAYAVKGWSARRVAETLGIGTGQVYLAKHRVGALVRKELLKLRDADL